MATSSRGKPTSPLPLPCLIIAFQEDDVEVHPILIQKGPTKLALYGSGSMRDEKLDRMWQENKVGRRRIWTRIPYSTGVT